MTPVELFLAKLPDAKRTGKGWSARCPAHEDRTASLSVSQGDDGRALVHCHAGCTPEAICASVGLRVADLMPTANGSPRPSKPYAVGKAKGNRRIVATYDYRDEAGNLLFQSVRFEPKGFSQRRPKPDGGWDWSVKGVRVVPYRLPELLAEPTRPVVVVEGEKDADALAGLGERGLLATCNAGGAGKWTTEHAEYLRGRAVVVLPDNDLPGRSHAQQVAQSLVGIAQQVRVVELPGLPIKGDVSDWLAAGGTAEELIRLVEATPVWTPSAATPMSKNRAEPEPPPYVPFPVELLPSPARDFIEAGGKALGCDYSYLALPLLAALASAVGNSRRIKLKGSWCEPCVIWAVIIGESGTLKSPALDLALSRIRFRQAGAYRAHVEAMREYAQWSQVYDADLAEWKKKGRKAGEPVPEPPEQPAWRQSVAEDTTVEALAVLLEDQPRGLLLARDEISGWLNSFDAYKSARGADVAHWLSMHRAGSMLVNRKSGRGFIRVPRASVSICGGVQPVTLAAALGGRYSADGPEAMDKPSSEHFGNGLAARLLMAAPPRLPKRWTDEDISDEISESMNERFDQLFSLELSTDENGEPVPVDLVMSPDAKARYIAFYNEHAIEQNDLHSDLSAVWSKAEGYAARFALLIELTATPNSMTISDASMAAGIGLARWFMDEAARIYDDLGGSGDNPESRANREQQRLVSWIFDRGGVATTRDVTRGLRRFRGKPDEADAALAELVKAGFGTFDPRPATDAGGRPTRVFMLAISGDGDETPQLPDKAIVSSPTPVSPSGKSEIREQVQL